MASRVEQLAYELADSTAISDIESYTVPDTGEPEHGWSRYYDTSTADEEDRPYVEQAMEYLYLRGLLGRHPKKPQLVRFKTP